MATKRECYWEECREKISHRWYPSKTPKSPLWVCRTHFGLLNEVYNVAVVRKSKAFTTVKVMPE